MQCPPMTDFVEKVESSVSLKFCQNTQRHLRSKLISAVNRFRVRPVDQGVKDEVPTSIFESRAYGAEKIGSSRSADFFNRIDPKQTLVLTAQRPSRHFENCSGPV